MVKSFIILQIIQCCKNLLSGQFCLQNVKCYFMNLTATTCILRKSYISNQTSQQFQCESCSLNRQDLMFVQDCFYTVKMISSQVLCHYFKYFYGFISSQENMTGFPFGFLARWANYAGWWLADEFKCNKL